MRSATPLLRNLAARALLGNVAAGVLLALTFLFAQQMASLHWLSHAIEATHAKAGAGSVPSEPCDECQALGALDAAAPVAGITLPIVATHHALAASPVPTPSPTALRLAFRSRAPPILV